MSRMLGQFTRGDGLWSLAYHSYRSGILDDDALLTLVNRAWARNHSVGITGILFFDGDHFIQVLEGRRRQVRALFDEIRMDSRHEGVTLTRDEPVDERAFDGWSMRLMTADDLIRDEREVVLGALRGVAGARCDWPAAADGAIAPLRTCSQALINGAIRLPFAHRRPDPRPARAARAPRRRVAARETLVRES